MQFSSESKMANRTRGETKIDKQQKKDKYEENKHILLMVCCSSLGSPRATNGWRRKPGIN